MQEMDDLSKKASSNLWDSISGSRAACSILCWFPTQALGVSSQSCAGLCGLVNNMELTATDQPFSFPLICKGCRSGKKCQELADSLAYIVTIKTIDAHLEATGTFALQNSTQISLEFSFSRSVSYYTFFSRYLTHRNSVWTQQRQVFSWAQAPLLVWYLYLPNKPFG